MNVHPIFVHFPIALLTIYALLELIQFKKVTSWNPWFYIKASFVVFGAIGTYAALFTGGLIEDQFRVGEAAKLVETHSTWAAATSIIFSFIAVIYLVSWIRRSGAFLSFTTHRLVSPVWKLPLQIEHYLLDYKIVVVLAVIGLAAVTITGALGGAIAFGPGIDPAAHFFYNLLVK